MSKGAFENYIPGRIARSFVYALLSIASITLLYVAVSANETSGGCGANFDCSNLLATRWSRWFGIPVFIPALGLYLLLGGGIFVLSSTTNISLKQRLPSFLVTVCLCLLGAAAWFLLLQVFVLRQFCPFCLMAHATGGLAAGLVLLPYALRRQHVGLRVISAAVLSVAVLVAGQVANSSPRQSNQITSTKAPLTLQTNRVGERVLAGKSFNFNLAHQPMIGFSNAPNHVVLLLDYRCHHCRDLRAQLHEVQSRFENELAIILLPVPLDASCNDQVKKRDQNTGQACREATDFLILWDQQPETLLKVEHRLWLREESPSSFPFNLSAQLTQDSQHAARRSAAEHQILTNISLYRRNRSIGIKKLPQLFYGSRIASGSFENSEQLLELLKTEFQFPATAKFN
jgi:uncharacterized membrane protein